MGLEQLIEKAREYLPDEKLALVAEAYAFAARANEGQMLHDYYSLLPEHARAGYGYDRFKLDYCACVTRSMLSAVMLVGPRYAGRPDQFALADVLAERVIAAVRDLDPMGAYRELGRGARQ